MRGGWRAALGIALSVALLAVTLRGVDPGSVWSVLAASDWRLFLAATVAATAIFPLRARRWRTILDPVAPNLPFGPLFRATAIGMAANNVLPARLGEPARAFALTRETPVGFAPALASLVVDRVFDAIVLLAFLAIAMLSAPFAPGVTVFGQPLQHVAVTAALAALTGITMLYLLVFLPAAALGLWSAFAGKLAPRFEPRGRALLEAFVSGLSVLREPARFVAVLWWTALHWLLNAFAFWLGFRAVGIEAPFTAALFLQSLISIGVAVPSSPGFFGVFEVIAREGLGLFGVAPSLAVSWGIGFHVLSFIPITLLGAWYAARLGFGLGKIGDALESERR